MRDRTHPNPDLSPERLQLLELLLKRDKDQTRPFAPRAGDVASFPLSYGQKALWFLQQLHPESSAYNIVTTMRIRGALDRAALRSSFSDLMVRHELLRAVFSAREGAPVQRIERVAPDCFREFDTTALTDADLYGLLRKIAREPFDLERAPLIRIGLFERQGQEHILQLVIHHIVTDLWSMVVFIDELGILYRTRIGGGTAALPPARAQYADYVLWQHRMFAGPEGEKSWEYWRNQLAGELPVLSLPADRPRPAVHTFAGDFHSMKLSPELTRELKSLAAEENVTLYSLALAVYFVLLHRLTGQSDIIVGSPTAGRTRAEFEGIFGYFVNPVILRANLSNDPGFSTLLKQVRENVLRAFEHQDFPLALLAERLRLARDASRPTLFQSMFVFQKAQIRERQKLMAFVVGEAGARAEIGGLPVEFMPVYKGTSQFDLGLTVTEVDDVLSASLNGNTDLFDSSTIKRFLGHFEVLLHNVATNPALPVSKLRILSGAEEDRIVCQWNAGAEEVEDAKCIHTFFEEQVERTPTSAAVVCEQHEIDYRELNRRANQLAHYLRALGAGPESMVGICLDRSIDMIVAMLAVLKAGAAYVPFDPHYPKERVAYLLHDTNAIAVITHERLVQRLPSLNLPTVCIGAGWEVISRNPDHNPPALATAANPAYVIYTSGSTGVPKGVVIEHRSACGLIFWAGREFTAAERLGVVASSSICCDCQLFEIFCTLSWGGTVILLDTLLDLPASAAAGRATLIAAAPTAMAELVRTNGVLPSVRVVNLSGEALPPGLAGQIYEQLNVQKVFNLYGASEASTYSTCVAIDRGKDAKVTVGRPIAGARIYILDANRQPVPIGVAGEIYLGGAGLARGYLNRPELTAERFTEDPFHNHAGGRIYRTGDLGRFLPNGCIEYLGRMDHQVKIRGFRVELGEIEAVMRQHPAIADCLALARTDASGERCLALYVLVPREKPPSLSELRSFARQRLPDYMTPSAFVVMREFPSMPNGKVNRAALPAPDSRRPETSADYVAPRNRTEEQLTRIWEEVLGIAPVGVHSDFFDLGGHSLMAIQILSRVCSAFGAQVPLEKFFESPTVAGLAGYIQRLEQEIAAPHGKALVRIPRGGDLPLSFAQEQRLAVDEWARQKAVTLKPFQTLVGIRLKGAMRLAVLQRTLNEIVRRHEVFRTTFHIDGGKAHQRVAPSRVVTLKTIDRGNVSDQELVRIAVAEAERPFDLTSDFPFRAALIRRNERDHILLLTIHHIVFDGWSQEILLREFAAIYDAFGNGIPSPLPEPVIEYADFAHWQRERLQGDVLNELISYWKRQLDGMGPIPELELPCALPLPANATFKAAARFRTLPSTLAQALRELSREKGVTLFMLMLAALKVWLHSLTGKIDIGVVAPVANRNRLETEAAIGWFANHLVFRTDLSGNPIFSELLERVRRAALEAFTHQDLPFSQLLDAFRYWDQPRRPYVFFSMPFIAPAETRHAADLEISPLELHCVGGIAEPGIEIHVGERAESLELSLVYEEERFASDQVTVLLNGFEELLKSLVQQPDERLSDLGFRRH